MELFLVDSASALTGSLIVLGLSSKRFLPVVSRNKNQCLTSVYCDNNYMYNSTGIKKLLESKYLPIYFTFYLDTF